MIKKYLVCLLATTLVTSFNVAKSQSKDSTKTTDLFADLENESKKADANVIDYATATFKSTRVISGHSIETIGKYNLDFRISHRFGYLNSGVENFFGLDNATMRIGLDYGVTNRLMIGIGRSNVKKELDGFVKYKLLRQSTGKVRMPVSVTLFANTMYYTQKASEEINATNRTSYTYQVLIARKFSDNVSFQLSPTLIHLNMVNHTTEKNNLFSLGLGGRVKISKRVAINAEYFHQFDKLEGTYNSASIGFDIETGGHVFQLHFTNSTGLTERECITNTTECFGFKQLGFGFNITRLFVLKKTPGSRSTL